MKVHVGVDRGAYRFDPANGLVYLYDLGELHLENILLITNVTRNTIIYDFSNSAKGGSLSGGILALTYSTIGMEPIDQLQIFVNVREEPKAIAVEEQPYGSCQEPVIEGEQYRIKPEMTNDVNLQDIFGSQNLLNDGRLKIETKWASDKIVSGLIAKGGPGVYATDLMITLDGHATVAVQTLAKNWTNGYIYFQGTADNVIWGYIYGHSAGGSYSYNSTGGSTIFKFPVAGLKAVRAVGYNQNAGAWVYVTMTASYTTYTTPGFSIGGNYQGSSQNIVVTQKGSPYELMTTNVSPISKRIFNEIPTWTTGQRFYNAGDMIKYQGKYMTCLVNHNIAGNSSLPQQASSTGYWSTEVGKVPKPIVTSMRDGTEGWDAARVKVSPDYEDYRRRLFEQQLLTESFSSQADLLYNDYLLGVEQRTVEGDFQAGVPFGLEGSSEIAELT